MIPVLATWDICSKRERDWGRSPFMFLAIHTSRRWGEGLLHDWVFPGLRTHIPSGMPLEGREENESLREPVTKLKSFSGTDEESSQYSLIHTLLAVHPVGAYEGGDGSFQSRHRRRLPLCAAVPSAPPHDAAPSVTRKREERLPGSLAPDAGA